MKIEEIAALAAAGERLEAATLHELLEFPNLPELAATATAARARMHPGRHVTYGAGPRLAWSDATDLDALRQAGATEAEIRGDAMGLEDALATINRLSSAGIETSALSPTSVSRLSASRSLDETLTALSEAGLRMLGPYELDAIEEPVLAAAAKQGVRSVVEIRLPPDDADQRIETLLRLRAVQDATRGIAAVVPLNARPGEISGSAFDYLRLVAVCRLALDNVPYLRSAPDLHGLKIAQLALAGGACDMGLLEWEREAYRVPVAEWERTIREAGFVPQCRGAAYDPRPTPNPPAPSQPIGFG